MFLKQNFNWSEEVKKYDMSKKNLQYEFPLKPKLITHQFVKQNDVIYNPILQTMNDKNNENQLRYTEKKKLIDTIAHNADERLRNEQSYNVINLQDKLKGMETHPNYPKENLQNIKKKLESSRVNYNIISNIGLDKHNFVKPEERLVFKEEPLKAKKIFSAAQTDYNYVYNRYLSNHEEKIKIEKEAHRLEAAQRYWKKHDYDPIQIKYLDDNKEREYQLKVEEEKKNLSKNKIIKIKSEGEAYNIISKQIINDSLLGEFQHQDNEKKKRYEIRHEYEKCNRNKEEGIREKESNKTKISYKKYKNIDERGYNIINQNDKKDYKNQLDLKHKKNDWEVLVEKSGKNNNLNIDNIFKDVYDNTDANVIKKKFDEDRKVVTDNIPDIKELFGNRTIKEKIGVKKKEEYNYKKVNIDKEKWFKENKEVDVANI